MARGFAGAQAARVVRGSRLEGADSQGDTGAGGAGVGARQGHEQLREVRGDGRPGAGDVGWDVGRVGGRIRNCPGQEGISQVCKCLKPAARSFVSMADAK